MDLGFNEAHVLAISQAICLYRKAQGIDGPLFIGIDTHALSTPAAATALEVLAANGVEVMLAKDDEYTPTPAISHAIICYNRGRSRGLADGIVITPSHNPPQSGGFKYNPPNGGPADSDVTKWIEAKANQLLADGLKGVQRMGHAQALKASTTHRHDYLGSYVSDLVNVIDFDVIRGAGLRLGVDPLGGAGCVTGRRLPSTTSSTWTWSTPRSTPRSASCAWTGTARSAWTRPRLTPCRA